MISKIHCLHSEELSCYQIVKEIQTILLDKSTVFTITVYNTETRTDHIHRKKLGCFRQSWYSWIEVMPR